MTVIFIVKVTFCSKLTIHYIWCGCKFSLSSGNGLSHKNIHSLRVVNVYTYYRENLRWCDYGWYGWIAFSQNVNVKAIFLSMAFVGCFRTVQDINTINLCLSHIYTFVCSLYSFCCCCCCRFFYRFVFISYVNVCVCVFMALMLVWLPLLFFKVIFFGEISDKSFTYIWLG